MSRRKVQPASTKTEYWCFTINNKSGDCNYDIPRDWVDVRYAVWQSEVGDSGTEHLQGYVVFNVRKAFSTVKNLCSKAHWEPRRGQHEQARDYCRKEESRVEGPWEIGSEDGIPKKKGQRSDLDALKSDIHNPELSFLDIASRNFGAFMRYHRAIDAYRGAMVQHRPRIPPKIFVFWGPSGSGKSRKAHEMFPNAYRKMKSDWWQGYTGQKEVIFDDFYGWIPYDEMLRILDWYTMDMPIKGSSVPLAATTFVFTSNEPYTSWYKKVKNLEALTRRIEEFAEVEYMEKPVAAAPVPEDELIRSPIREDTPVEDLNDSFERFCVQIL